MCLLSVCKLNSSVLDNGGGRYSDLHAQFHYWPKHLQNIVQENQVVHNNFTATLLNQYMNQFCPHVRCGLRDPSYYNCLGYNGIIRIELKSQMNAYDIHNVKPVEPEQFSQFKLS